MVWHLQKGIEMARPGHDTADTGIHGRHMGYGPAHDVLAAVFFGGRRRRVYTELATRSGARRGDRVLDVGCGDGYFTRVMAKAVGAAGTAVGVDPSPEAIARARQVTRAVNCTFSEGVAEHLDASEGSYDVVVSSLMVHHLPEAMRPQAIREMFRVLRPGGRVLIAEFRPPQNRIVRYLIGLITSPAMQHNPLHLLEPMMDDAGFQRVHSGDLNPWIRYVQAVKPTTIP
jgi:ubiquinone/menaquinone biosynthesis C-methylase UbiE